MTALLDIQHVHSGYGEVIAVRDVSLTVASGEIVAILGPNGAGKTTLLHSIAGLVTPRSGSILLAGTPVTSRSPVRQHRDGIVLVPDNRALFRAMTVKEHLQLAGRRGRGVSDMLDMFPSLQRRLHVKAGMLSGGEQQMLAMARALLRSPKVLLVDEMSMGLAPIIVRELLSTLRNIADTSGTAVLLVEQHVPLALQTADRAVVVTHGAVSLEGTASELLASPERIEAAYLGAAADRSAEVDATFDRP